MEVFVVKFFVFFANYLNDRVRHFVWTCRWLKDFNVSATFSTQIRIFLMLTLAQSMRPRKMPEKAGLGCDKNSFDLSAVFRTTLG
jgi:hypothetical protein